MAIGWFWEESLQLGATNELLLLCRAPIVGYQLKAYAMQQCQQSDGLATPMTICPVSRPPQRRGAL